jgi:hypothetical protein
LPEVGIVDFDLFESLSPNEARSLLEGFLETESVAVEEMLAKARQQGLRTDYSLRSTAPLMRWAISQVKTTPLPENPELPIWIRETDSCKSSLLGFDQSSKAIVLRPAYYPGECLVRTFPGLTWAVASHETAEKKHARGRRLRQ